jgi:predicted secreted hydrolase
MPETRKHPTRRSTLSIEDPLSALLADSGQSRFRLGSVDLDAEFPDLVMMNGGSGVFSSVGGLPTEQYSIPSGQGSGTLTVNGTNHDFSGNVWFDRQWTITRDLFGKGSDGTTLRCPGAGMDIDNDSDSSPG